MKRARKIITLTLLICLILPIVSYGFIPKEILNNGYGYNDKELYYSTTITNNSINEQEFVITMKDELFNLLEGELRPNDRFILLPPYYAGGTASFHPTAEEVLTEYQNRSSAPARFMTFPDRDLLRAFLLQNAGSDDIIVIMGARDNSLSDYAASLCI